MPKYKHHRLLAIGAVAGVAIGASALSTTAPANAGNTAAATRAECTLALDDYQSEINTANKFDQLAFDYEGEIMPAYKAGQAGSGAQVQAITEKLAMWNVEVSALADEARALNPKLKQAVGTCEVLLKAGG